MGAENEKNIKKADWTVDPKTNRVNSSEKYNSVVDAVNELIRGSAYDLISGNTETVARLIVSHLAYEHGLAPISDIENKKE